MGLPGDVEATLYLGDAGDCCDHLDATADLPRLRLAVDAPGRDGWAHLVLHWTGSRWAHCDDPVWSIADGMSDEELTTIAQRGLDAANAVTAEDWWARYRTQVDATLEMLRKRLEYDELRVRCLRTKIRLMECHAALGELRGAPATVARRLVRDWAGSAAELVATANALAVGQDDGSPTPS